MSKKSLEKQADRADRVADQTVDDEVRQNLRDAAKEYRGQAKDEKFEPKPGWRLPKDIS